MKELSENKENMLMESSIKWIAIIAPFETIVYPCKPLSSPDEEKKKLLVLQKILVV